ncbi:MAG: PAS domain-containing protein [Clostridia bacterium]|nr:PAS domain-containing protein [Clostridia bacterium]
MTDEMLESCGTLVRFLGAALGPCYEITLYDMETETPALVAIANGRISGQTVGGALPPQVRELLEQRHEQGEFVINFAGRLRDGGRLVRSSMMFLRGQDGKPAGLLGINFDDGRFRELSTRMLELLHPDDFLRQFASGAAVSAPANKDEPLLNEVSDMMREIFAAETASLSVPAERLDAEERRSLIAALNARGMFRLKGAVPYAAERLGCSASSIYRYLSELK